VIVRSASQTPRGLPNSASAAPRTEYVESFGSLSTATLPRGVSTLESWRRPLLEDVLRGIRPQSGVAYWPEFRAPWGVGFKRDWAVFHIVAQGDCWLHLNGWGEPVPLSEGDFAVVRKAQCHTMRDSPSTPAVDFADLLRSLAPGEKGAVSFGGEGQVTRLVCGGIEDRRGHPLMGGLPPLLHLKGGDSGTPGWVLFLHAVRSFLDESAENGDVGWLAAIRDQQIGRALAAIHREPRRSWTVESLARHVAMSRTMFAAKFRDLVGEPPQHYFTRLRISAAAVRLRSSHDKLSAVAADAGYRSLAAFLKSFKRHMGITPGEYRDRRDGWPL